jgi:formamidopyrimidine-DNA glycosylase
MPELPEVETVMRGMEGMMLASPIKSVKLNRPDIRFVIPKTLPAKLKNQPIQNLMRRGKYILGFSANGAGFVLHLGMSGRVRLYESTEHYTPEKHDHVVFEMQNGARVIFNDPRRFGFLDLVEAGQWEQSRHFKSMGPEPLGNAFNAEVLAAALAGKKTPIKVVLLDQSVVAGVGNIYACEALYRSGISPFTVSGTLSVKACDALARAIKDVLVEAIAAGGSTLRDYRKADGELGYFQHQFGVYDRAGLACPDCTCDRVKTGGVARVVQGGRSTFYCKVRQA